MPETIMPLLTGLFLVFAGMLIGYFLWFRDRSQDEALQLQLHSENEELSSALKKVKVENNSLANDLSSQKGKLHILQELCDDLVSGREQFQMDRVALESDVSAKRARLEEVQTQLDTEKRRRMDLEETLHHEQRQASEKLSASEETWRTQVSRLESELLHRNTDIKQMTGVHERTSEQLHASEAIIAELRSELASQNTMLEAARQAETGLEKEHFSLATSLRSHSELLKESRGQCAAALSAKKLAEEAVRNVRKQLEDQNHLIRKMDEVNANSESLKLRCLSLEQSLENSEDRIRQLTSERDSSMAAHKQVGDNVSALQTRLENQEQTIRQLRQKCDEFSINVRDEKATRLELESSFKDDKHRLESRIQELRSEIEKLEVERDQLSGQVNNLEGTSKANADLVSRKSKEADFLKTTCDDLSEQIKSLREEFTTLQQSRDQLVLHVNSLEQATEDNDKLLSQRELELTNHASLCQDLASQVSLLEEQRGLLSEKVAILEASSDEKEQLLLHNDSEFNGYASLCEDLTKQIATLEEQRGQLTEQVASFESLLSENGIVLDEQSVQLTHYAAVCEDLTTKVTSLEEARSHDKRRVETLSEERTRLREELRQLRENHSLGLSAIEERNVEVERLTTRIAEIEAALAAQQETISSTSEQLESVMDENVRLVHQRDELTIHLQTAKESFARGSSLLEDRLVELKQLRDERDSLLDRLRAMEAEIDAANQNTYRQNEEIQTRINILISQRDKAFTDLDALRMEIMELRSEIEELRQQQAEPVILRFGEAMEREYGGVTQRHETRGTIFVEPPETKDDLKLISGVAHILEKRLNDYGVYTFKQIMEWEEATIQEFSTLLTFKDRIDRDDWLGQAEALYEAKHRKKRAA